MDLKSIEPLVLHHDELTIWCFTENNRCWPIAKGTACRDWEFNVTVYLDPETRVAWQYLRQHLAADPVWESIDSWKSAMERDLEARLSLLRTIAKLIQEPIDEGGTGLPVVASIGYD
jgi:hypothetical protein